MIAYVRNAPGPGATVPGGQRRRGARRRPRAAVEPGADVSGSHPAVARRTVRRARAAGAGGEPRAGRGPRSRYTSPGTRWPRSATWCGVRATRQRAAALWREATLVRARLADRRGIAGCLERLALVLAASDRFLAAAWLFGAAEAQHRLLGIALRHDEEIDHEHLLAVTQRTLGKDFAEAYAAGQASASDEAVERALSDLGAMDAGVPRLEHAAGVVLPHPGM